MKKILQNLFNDEEPSPPPFKSWRSWYAVVLGNLILLIILFYILSRTLE
jgi:hypothetical protein